MSLKNTLKALGNAGDDAVQAGGDIGAKTRMIQQYKDATTPKTPAPTPQPSGTPAPKRNPANQYGTRPGEKRYKLGPDGEILGQYKKGGKVKKTGVYKLHKAERVLNAKQTKKFDAKGGLKALGGKA